ncbi:hypothetical protein GGI12_002718 [Dipsacomyces acuminosporus]|nr:hypothetical protein GGI12_002718 [Dipsacomyces acuminosporus]
MSRSHSTHRPSAAASAQQQAAASSARPRQPSHAHGPLAQPLSRNGLEDAERERRGGGHNGGSTKHIPCKFFKHGNCTAGADCSFSHDINAFVEKAVCAYFLKGNCKYGSKCVLLHTNSHDSVSSRQPHSHSGSKKPNGGTSGSATGAFSNGSAANARRSSPPTWAAAAASMAASNTKSSSAAGIPAEDHTAASPSSLSSKTGTGAKAKAHVKTGSIASIGHSGRQNGSGGHGANDEYAAENTATNAWSVRHSGLGKADSGIAVPALANADGGSDSDNQHHPLSLLDGEPFDSSVFGRQPSLSPMSLRPAQQLGDIEGDGGLSARSQPIPKPAIGSRRGHAGGYTAAAGGLSVQDSLRIETLAMSQSAVHQSLSGSPFLSGSIPLLDQFKESSRLDGMFGSGTSPTSHSFARSPPASASGFGLMRHAFTHVDSNSISTPGTQDMDLGSSLRSIYHSPFESANGSNSALDTQLPSAGNGHHESTHAIDPIGTARSIPRAADALSRSFRSSSLVSDSRSPLTSLMTSDFASSSTSHSLLSNPYASPLPASGASTLPGRIRSNTQATPASLLFASAGLGASNSADIMPLRSPLSARDSSIAGHSIPSDSTVSFNPGLWDSQALPPTSDALQGSGSQKFADPPTAGYRLPVGGLSLASQRTSASLTSPSSIHQYYHHHQQQQQHQHQHQHQQKSQASSFSPFATAANGYSTIKHFASPQLAPSASTAGGPVPAGLGQKLGTSHQKALGISASTSHIFMNAIPVGAANHGSGSSASATNVTGRSSANGSSAASDHDGEMFELEPEPEPELPAQPRISREHSLVSNPDFISLQAFTRKISGLSLSHADGSKPASVRSANMAQPLPEMSALSRPLN